MDPPNLTSSDHAARINESGAPSKKYFQLRLQQDTSTKSSPRDRAGDADKEYSREKPREYDNDRDRGRDRNRDPHRDRDRETDRDRDRRRDRDRESDREYRSRNSDRDRRDRGRDRDYHRSRRSRSRSRSRSPSPRPSSSRAMESRFSEASSSTRFSSSSSSTAAPPPVVVNVADEIARVVANMEAAAAAKANELYDPEHADEETPMHEAKGKTAVAPPAFYKASAAPFPSSQPFSISNLKAPAKDLQKRKQLFQNVPKEEAPAQTWVNSQFEDASRKDKFLSLMGAKKHKIEPSAAQVDPQVMDPTQISQRNTELEQQYITSRRLNRGGTGLGFTEHFDS